MPRAARRASTSASAAGPTSPGATTSIRTGLPHSQELHYASRQLTAIEVNGTYYSTFKPATFAKWRDETPDGFVFSLKANRFATNRKLLATAGESIERFVGSGIAELGDKLGPDRLAVHADQAVRCRRISRPSSRCCPRASSGRALRHVLDVRHASFVAPDYLPLARRYGCTTVHHRLGQVPGHRRRDRATWRTSG